MKKIVITDELREVLKQMESVISLTLLDEVDESRLVDAEKHINYLDLSHTDKGHLSYLNKERIEKIEQTEEKDYWRKGMRYHGRPGSVLKKLFNSSMRGHFEEFSIKFLAITDKPDFHLEVVKGKDIAKYYNYNNYREQYGNLGNSCMARVSPEIFNFYVENPKVINMLVMLDQNDKVMGRSLLWIGKDFKVLDRIYVSNDLYTGYFTDWAKKNKVFYKEQNNFRTPMHMIDPESGEKVFKEFSIDLQRSFFRKYPYLDSFKWIDRMNRKLYNYIPKGSTYNKKLPKDNHGLRVLCDSMGGTNNGDIYGIDDITRNMHGSHDIFYLDYLDMNVYDGSLRHSNALNRYILRDHAFYDEEIGDYIFNEEYSKFNDKEKIEKARIRYEERKKNGEDKKKNIVSSVGDRWWENPEANIVEREVWTEQRPIETREAEPTQAEIDEFFNDIPD